jgi:alanine dehydrogenase
MKVGVPTEIKTDEYRVSLTPAGTRELKEHGHEVLVQAGAGVGSTIPDAEYEAQGARILPDANAVFDEAELILGVKEPQHGEVSLLRPHHTLFTYLHLAPDPELTTGLCETGATCIAYETVVDEHGRLPLLAPMSEVAGKIATQAGAFMLEKPLGGRGILLGGVPGVEPARVVILGAGVAGSNALAMAVGLGADVTVIDRDLARLKAIDAQYGGRVRTVYSTRDAIERHVLGADLVIGTVLIPGAAAPKLVTREMILRMKAGAAIVDVAVDQGGCCETTRPTTHAEPTFVVGGVVHYCVANMPGAVARTSTFALTNATLPYVLTLADKGWRRALADDPHFRSGLNVCRGRVTLEAVARDLALDYTPAETCLAEAA